MQLWKDWMGLWETTARRMLGGEAPSRWSTPAPGDRRFRDAEWQQNEIFDFIKQSYLLTANAMQEMVANLHGIPDKERKRVEFYTSQFADAFAPTNFPLTNPEVLRATLASNGENLVKGLDNLLADIERGQGELSIRQSADGFVHRREYRHRAGQGGVPQRADRAAAIRSGHRSRSMSGRC